VCCGFFLASVAWSTARRCSTGDPVLIVAMSRGIGPLVYIVDLHRIMFPIIASLNLPSFYIEVLICGRFLSEHRGSCHVILVLTRSCDMSLLTVGLIYIISKIPSDA